MDCRKLGHSDLRISRLGFGAWAIGGGNWEFGWGPQDDRDSIAAIHRALDLGVNWIDTAAVYGLGRSETVVARALEGRSPRPYVFTKCGLVWDGSRRVSHRITRPSILREVDDSLRRLRVEAIDLYQIHWPQLPPTDPAPYVEEAWQTLADLTRAGKVRWIGVSNFTVEHLERARAIAPIASLQPPYSMLSRGVEAEVLPYCERHGIGVIVYSSMKSGLLSGAMTRARIAAMPDDDWRKTKNPEFQEPNLTRNLRLVEILREIGLPHHRSPAEVAVAWTLRHPAVTATIVGARTAAQVDGWIGSADFQLSHEALDTIDRALSEA
jgi:aryl-alcohol dehydrogenase-like predicted oxidoreductase